MIVVYNEAGFPKTRVHPDPLKMKGHEHEIMHDATARAAIVAKCFSEAPAAMLTKSFQLLIPNARTHSHP